MSCAFKELSFFQTGEVEIETHNMLLKNKKIKKKLSLALTLPLETFRNQEYLQQCFIKN